MRRGRTLALTALCTALIALGAQLCIPSPFGVPITFQLFFIAVICFAVGLRVGVTAVTVYLLLGAAGAPIFSAFGGGVHVLLSPTGGFLWSFLPMALCFGFAYGKKDLAACLLSFAGLIICHACGVIQFCFISGAGAGTALVGVSLPYFIKDALLVFLAYCIAKPIKKSLSTSS